MAKREGQKQKLFRILEILMRETDDTHGVTIEIILARLAEQGISAERKSIYDDFLTLEELGFPVGKLPTRPTTYTLEARPFELPELKMLVDAVQASRFITAKKSREIIGKLEEFAGARHARELSRQVYVDHRVKTMNASGYYFVDQIHEAIGKDCQIRFTYFDYGVQKEKVLRHAGGWYVVSPYALLWEEQNYYLSGFDEEAKIAKNFRVDKIAKLEILNTPPSPLAKENKIDPAEYSKCAFGMYGGEDTIVTLRCAARLAGVVIDRFGTEPTFSPDGDGFRVSVHVMLSPNFYAWVLEFGSDMKIVGPEKATAGMRDLLDRARSLYREDAP